MSGSSSESLRQSLGWELIIASFHGRILEVIALLIQGAPVNAQEARGFTSLMCAAQAGHLEIVERLLNAGADHNLKPADGGTALSVAVTHQHEAIAELLLRAGADPNVVSSNGFSLTWLAIDSNHPRMLEILLEGGASLNGSMKNNKTNLAFAAQRNKPEAVKILLDHGALPSDTPEDEKHPLLLAAQYGHPEIVQLLMGNVSLPLSEEARNGSNALWMAASMGQVEVVDCLLNMGIPVDSPLIIERVSSEMKREETPLLAAIVQGHLAVVERLIAAGADVNWSRGKHGSPLWVAVEENKVEIVKVLLNAGADINQQCTQNHSTALYLAARLGHEDVINVLLERRAPRRADVELPDINGVTPLYAASAMTEGAALALLLAAGADPNVVKNTGACPLMGVVIEHKLGGKKDVQKTLDIMQQLLDAGADINAVDGGNCTSLIYACGGDDTAVIRFLVERGDAELNAFSNMGTALQLAAFKGNVEAVKSLLDAGADTTLTPGGMTALEIATKFGRHDVVEVLVAHAKLG